MRLLHYLSIKPHLYVGLPIRCFYKILRVRENLTRSIRTVVECGIYGDDACVRMLTHRIQSGPGKSTEKYVAIR